MRKNQKRNLRGRKNRVFGAYAMKKSKLRRCKLANSICFSNGNPARIRILSGQNVLLIFRRYLTENTSIMGEVFLTVLQASVLLRATIVPCGKRIQSKTKIRRRYYNVISVITLIQCLPFWFYSMGEELYRLMHKKPNKK